jgi:hypothetical protein
VGIQKENRVVAWVSRKKDLRGAVTTLQYHSDIGEQSEIDTIDSLGSWSFVIAFCVIRKIIRTSMVNHGLW